VASTRELAWLPVLAHVDFGHTSPLDTFPIGGHGIVRAPVGEAPEITVGLA
jgi:muramoyltetrapeptide carboxypeptidase LdcA involved in peptidoglycan recycling